MKELHIQEVRSEMAQEMTKTARLQVVEGLHMKGLEGEKEGG